MSSWLLGIIGIVFLSVMIDILYPNGKTNAFCKSIFGIFAVAIFVTPILNLKKLDGQVFNNFVSESLLMTLEESKENCYKARIESELNSKGFNGVIVEIDGNLDENEFIIKNAYIDISELVLSENLENINKYEVITNLVLEIIDIEKEGIVIYG